MKKLFPGFVLSLILFTGSVGTVRADGGYCCPWARSAAFPTVLPPGWYTNTYSYNWQYPWYAYYNYSHGPYANWFVGQGRAGYANQTRPQPIPTPAEVTIFLPEAAKLSFSGVVATGKGAIRSFSTPVLELNQDYAYEMTAEVTIDGKTHKMSKTVKVHAGESVKVTFDLPESKEVIPAPMKK